MTLILILCFSQSSFAGWVSEKETQFFGNKKACQAKNDKSYSREQLISSIAFRSMFQLFKLQDENARESLKANTSKLGLTLTDDLLGYECMAIENALCISFFCNYINNERKK